MSAGAFGALTVQFLFAVVFGMFAAALPNIIPSMRPKLELRYSIGAVATFLPGLILYRDIGELEVLAALLACGVLFWDFKRQQAAQIKRNKQPMEGREG